MMFNVQLIWNNVQGSDVGTTCDAIAVFHCRDWVKTTKVISQIADPQAEIWTGGLSGSKPDYYGFGRDVRSECSLPCSQEPAAQPVYSSP
jgi:hypothetical protein